MVLWCHPWQFARYRLRCHQHPTILQPHGESDREAADCVNAGAAGPLGVLLNSNNRKRANTWCLLKMFDQMKLQVIGDCHVVPPGNSLIENTTKSIVNPIIYQPVGNRDIWVPVIHHRPQAPQKMFVTGRESQPFPGCNAVRTYRLLSYS